MIVSQKIMYYHAIVHFSSLVSFSAQSFILLLRNKFFFSFKLSFSFPLDFQFSNFSDSFFLFFSFHLIACVWSAFVPCAMLMSFYTTICISRALTRHKSDFFHLPLQHKVQTLQLMSNLSF